MAAEETAAASLDAQIAAKLQQLRVHVAKRAAAADTLRRLERAAAGAEQRDAMPRDDSETMEGVLRRLRDGHGLVCEGSDPLRDAWVDPAKQAAKVAAAAAAAAAEAEAAVAPAPA